MIEIKKGVPVPTGKTSGGRPCRYPYTEMEIGDCFDVSVAADEKADAVVRRMRVAATGWKKRNTASCGFAVRVMDEGGQTLVRVWKTEARVPKPKAVVA